MGPGQRVARFAYPPPPFGLTRLADPWSQAEIRADVIAAAEATGILDRSIEGERADRSNARNRHEKTADIVFIRDPAKPALALFQRTMQRHGYVEWRAENRDQVR